MIETGCSQKWRSRERDRGLCQRGRCRIRNVGAWRKLEGALSEKECRKGIDNPFPGTLTRIILFLQPIGDKW